VKTSLRFLFSILGLIVGISVLGFFIRIKKVECWLGVDQRNDSRVCQQLQSLKGGRLLFRDFYQDKDVLAATVITETKEVFSLKNIDKSLNGTVIFYLEETPPLYRLLVGAEKRIFTESGENRADDVETVLPEVIDEQQLFLNNFDYYHQFLSEFLTTLDKDKAALKKIYFLSGNKLRFETAGFPPFLVDPDQSAVDQAKRLKIIFNQLEPKEVDVLIQEIDLRFELPVLRTYESSDSAELLIDSQE
jgi:hypothetical protein